MPSSVWLSHEKQKKLHSFMEHLFSQVGQHTNTCTWGFGDVAAPMPCRSLIFDYHAFESKSVYFTDVLSPGFLVCFLSFVLKLQLDLGLALNCIVLAQQLDPRAFFRWTQSPAC